MKLLDRMHPGAFALVAAGLLLGSADRSAAGVVFSDSFDYTAGSAFLAEGGWSYWNGTGGSDAGSGICWGQSIVLEFEYPTALAAGESITMDAVLNRPWAGYFYGMRIVLWDGSDDASRIEVAGGSYQGNALPQVSYAVTPADIGAGRTHVIFRYSHDGNWGESQEVSFAVDAAPTGWTWNNAAGGSWATVGDWSPDGPADAADQTASVHLLDITGDRTITLDGNYTIGSVFFADSAGADGNWILDPGTGGPLTLSAPVNGSPGIEVGNQTATVNAVLAGTEGLTKSGAGTLVLGAANTYTGGTTVAAGTLRVGNPAAIPSGTGAGNVSLTGILDLADTGITLNGLIGNGTVTNSGTGTPTLTIGADNADGLTFAGAINNGGGTTSVTKTGTGTLTLTGVHGLSGSVNVEGGTLVMTGGFNRYLNVASITAGPGATAELNGGNMLVPGHGTALDPSRVLSADGGTLFMNTGADLRIGNVNLANGATWTIDRPTSAFDVLLADTTSGPATVTVANSGGNTSPSTMNGAGGLHLQGVQHFDIADVTGDAGDDLIVDLPLANPGFIGGASGGIEKLGTGTMRLGAANSYTGNTVLTAGHLILEEFAALRFVIGANGVNNKVTGTGTAYLDGDFDIDLTGADDTNGNSWFLVDAPNASFGPGFFIPGFTENNDVHTYDDGTAVWTFTEATGTLSVERGLDYSDWAALNAGNQTAEEDFDGDGTPNGVEFFMGETGSSFTARPTLVGGTITWQKDPEANAGYVIETSTNLLDEVVPGDGGWTAAATGVINDDGTSVSYTPLIGETKLFIRLRVNIP